MAVGAGWLWHPAEVRRDELKAGDHIFSWRIGMSYSHHGVYVGADEVIHFTRQQADEIGSNALLDYAASVSPALQRTSTIPPNTADAAGVAAAGPGGGAGSAPCRACGTEDSSHGVISSCLRCFLHGGRLFRFDYAVSVGSFCLQMRGGTCSMAEPDPPHAVVQRARLLLKEGFGRYHVLDNNCEDFAVFCKTRALVVDKTRVGTSGQSAAFFGFNFASATAAVPLLLVGPLAAAAVFAGSYSLSRVALDVGVRRDVVKVEGEELVASLKGGGRMCGDGTGGRRGKDGVEMVVARMRGGVDVQGEASPQSDSSAKDGSAWKHEVARLVQESAKLVVATSASVAVALSAGLGIAEARPEGVNKPELLPKEFTTVIDVADFLSTGQEQRLAKDVERLEQDTGYKLRILAQNYPNTPGLAIRDYWGVDDETVVFVADPNMGNLLNFNVGATVDLSVPRSFWSRLAGKYGNVFYWREKGEDAAIEAAVIAIDHCLREDPGPRQCAEIK
ncbi:unnamed protein product [Closterium sp. Yama58-4]|nr:unnamed protein product [Closterium sp. Yama58-4]